MENKFKFDYHELYFIMTFDGIEDIEGDRKTHTDWLYTDVGSYHKTLEYIDKVISKEVQDEFLWGNAYKVYVGQEFTEIHFNYEEESSAIKPCKLPTRLLREIVAAWLEEYEKFCNKKK